MGETMKAKEKRAGEFLDYLQQLKLRLSSIGTASWPDFNTNSMLLLKSLDSSNFNNREIFSLQDNIYPRGIYGINDDNYMGLRPGGINGGIIYYVHKENPDQIFRVLLRNPSSPTRIFMHPDAYQKIHQMSQYIKNENFDRLFISELKLPMGFVRDLHYVELHLNGNNFWGFPRGEGPIVF